MKYLPRIPVLFICLLLSLAVSHQAVAQKFSGSNKPDPELIKQDKAVVFGEKAARAWLALLDNGKYAQSWEQAAPMFKKAVSQKDWIKGIKASRGTMGRLHKREIATADYATKISGAPDGEYVLLQYISSFSRKKSAVETVTPMLCKDGVWRVSGYYIR